MLVLILDTETSSQFTERGDLDAAASEMVEIAALVYDNDSKVVISKHCCLFKVQSWSKEAEQIHRIPEDLANKHGMVITIPCSDDVREYIYDAIGLTSADVIMAYNASFDKNVLVKYFPEMEKMPWICAMRDLPHEEFLGVKLKSKKQVMVALEYGVVIDPRNLHRALGDCELTYQIAQNFDIQEILEERENDKRKYVDITTDPGPFNAARNDKMKELGFRFQFQPKKHWRKSRVPEDEVEELKKKALEIYDGWNFKTEEYEQDY